MQKIREYLNDVYDEFVNKVSWPTWEELQGSTIAVLVASLVFAVVIYLMDAASSFTLGQFYKLFEQSAA